MNITELEKIAKQIKKYQLEDEIRDIENWLGKLNKKQIKNFISLEINPLKLIGKLKSLLVSAKALNGDYYLEDIKLINEAKTDEIANWLSNVAMNANSLESEHHREDMKLIADAKDFEISNCLSIVSMNVNSLESEHHIEDMKLIADAKGYVIACYLSDVSMDADSLESEYHREDMKLIADAKSDKIAWYLGMIAKNKYLLKSKYHREDMKRLANAKNDKDANEIYDNIIKQYEVKNKKEESNYVTFQEKIDAIHQNAVEYADGDTTKELNDSVFTLK